VGLSQLVMLELVVASVMWRATLHGIAAVTRAWGMIIGYNRMVTRFVSCMQLRVSGCMEVQTFFSYYTVLQYDFSVLYVLISSHPIRRFGLQFKGILKFFTKYRHSPLNVRVLT